MSGESTKKLIRLPVDLDAELRRRADEQGTSVNTLIVVLLAGGVNFKLPKKP